MRRRRSRGGEGGFSAVEWTLGIGALVLPIVIGVMSIAPMLDRLTTARVAAQEAARAMVLADDWDGGLAAAESLAAQIVRNHGIPDAEWCAGAPASGCVWLRIGGDSPGVLGRGTEVTVTVQVPAPAVSIPFLGDFGGVDLAGTHTERVDDYRSFP